MYVLLPLRTTAAASITIPPWQKILSRWCYMLHRYRQLLRTDLLLTCSGACNAVLTYRLACSALAQPSPSRFKTKEHRSIVRTAESREKREKRERPCILLHSQRHAPRRLVSSISLLQYSIQHSYSKGDAREPSKSPFRYKERGEATLTYLLYSAVILCCACALCLHLTYSRPHPHPHSHSHFSLPSSFYLIDWQFNPPHQKDGTRICSIQSCPALPSIQSTKY
ncbi:hypothetical protein GGI42DRAFT_233871 [Trichoderma sp. SZMC 28013]